MEDLERQIRTLANELITKNTILSVLNTLSQNMHLSHINLLLVAKQRPEASCVCGKNAWRQLEREVKPDAVPIQILFPRIKESFRYQVVNAYDYDSTEGRQWTDKRILKHPADRITELTGATWEIEQGSAIRDSLEKGFYDKAANIFYLSEGGAAESGHQTILALYVEYVMTQLHLNDKLVGKAVLYVVHTYFGCKSNLVNALFGKLDRISVEEKLLYIKNVQRISRRIIEDLTVDTLNFNEIAFLNELLWGEDIEAACKLVWQAAVSIEQEDIREELTTLAEKLEICERQSFAEICSKKAELKLFTYPPVEVRMRKKDTILEE